ncbi:hypothetical protein [Streptomyces sp. NPDC013455]|uniref:hypothetical protein n=1 Tax=Streptomyces sp. NPDC013455 TaxID=3155605 RepID=UPI0033F9CE73
MSDRTYDSGTDEHPEGRFTRRPGDEATTAGRRGPAYEGERAATDEWSPGDAAPGHRTPRAPRPEERLPGEPPPGPGRPAREPGAGGGTGRFAPETGAGADASRPADSGAGAGRLRGSAGPGREGLTGDDRSPQDTPQRPPGPAGTPEGAAERHGTEGLRPGTEEMGAGIDEGFVGSHRTERSAISEEDRMPDNGLGAPSPGEVTGREKGGTESPGPDSWPAPPGGRTAPAPSGAGAPLLAQEETERWEERIRRVTADFVDEPRQAVEQADRALEEIAARFGEAVTRRRRTLRMSWEGGEESGPGATTDTEQLRLALRDYRDLAGRLLHG